MKLLFFGLIHFFNGNSFSSPSSLPFSTNPTPVLSNSCQAELALLFFSSIFLRKLFSFIPLLDSHFILEIERFILSLLFPSFFEEIFLYIQHGSV